MAEFKFSCPHCGQHIQCDHLWGGHQIKCPACQGDLTVPQIAAAPVAASAAPPPVPISAPPRSMPPSRPGMPPSSQMPGRPNIPTRPPATAGAGGKNKLVKILVGTSVLAVCAVGGYFAFGVVADWQNKANEKRREVEKRSDGGEMGHIGNLYEVLDATEPGGRGLSAGKYGSGPGQRAAGAAHPIHVAGEEDDMEAPEKKLPLAPAVYTLDISSVTFPDGRANGMVSGTNFVVDEAYVELSGNNQVLRLIDGSPYNPDREVLIYIQLKSGGTLAGRSFSVAKDAKGTEIVQVTKRGRAKPGMPAELKSYNTGFALKLDIGQGKDGEIPAKLFVALPDKEQSVVAGSVTVRPPPKVLHFRDDF